MTPVIDNEQTAERIYRAEDQTIARMIPESKMNLEEVLLFVTKVTSSEWWLRRSPVPVIKIRDGRGDKRALSYQSDGVIILPKWARTRPIILHELAHVLTNNECEPHGSEFAANVMDLYKKFLGKRWALVLADRFRANKIRWQDIRYRQRFNIVRPTYDVPRARKPKLV